MRGGLFFHFVCLNDHLVFFRRRIHMYMVLSLVLLAFLFWFSRLRKGTCHTTADFLQSELSRNGHHVPVTTRCLDHDL
jgi:hypothetical protein